MPIDRTTFPSSLIAALRVELTQRRSEGLVRAGKPKIGADSRSGPTSNLRTEVAQLVRGVDLADPVAVRAARRRVIRLVLLTELGQELREHSQWQPMLDTLVDNLERNPAHRETFEAFIRSVAA